MYVHTDTRLEMFFPIKMLQNGRWSQLRPATLSFDSLRLRGVSGVSGVDSQTEVWATWEMAIASDGPGHQFPSARGMYDTHHVVLDLETCGGYIICSLYTKWHSEVVAGLCSLPNIGGSSEISSRFKVSLDIRNSPTHPDSEARPPRPAKPPRLHVIARVGVGHYRWRSLTCIGSISLRCSKHLRYSYRLKRKRWLCTVAWHWLIEKYMETRWNMILVKYHSWSIASLNR